MLNYVSSLHLLFKKKYILIRPLSNNPCLILSLPTDMVVGGAFFWFTSSRSTHLRNYTILWHCMAESPGSILLTVLTPVRRNYIKSPCQYCHPVVVDGTGNFNFMAVRFRSRAICQREARFRCVLTFSLLVAGFPPGGGLGLLHSNLGFEIKDGNRQAFYYSQALSVTTETRESHVINRELTVMLNHNDNKRNNKCPRLL